MSNMPQVLLSKKCRVVFQPSANSNAFCVWCKNSIDKDDPRVLFEPTIEDGAVHCCFECIVELQETLDRFEPADDEVSQQLHGSEHRRIGGLAYQTHVRYAKLPHPDGLNCLVCGTEVGKGGTSHVMARGDEGTAAAHMECLLYEREKPFLASILEVGDAEGMILKYGGLTEEAASRTCLGCGETLVPTTPHFVLRCQRTAAMCHTQCWSSVSDVLHDELWAVAAEHGDGLLGDLL